MQLMGASPSPKAVPPASTVSVLPPHSCRPPPPAAPALPPLCSRSPADAPLPPLLCCRPSPAAPPLPPPLSHLSCAAAPVQPPPCPPSAAAPALPPLYYHLCPAAPLPPPLCRPFPAAPLLPPPSPTAPALPPLCRRSLVISHALSRAPCLVLYSRHCSTWAVPAPSALSVLASPLAATLAVLYALGWDWWQADRARYGQGGDEDRTPAALALSGPGGRSVVHYLVFPADRSHESGQGGASTVVDSSS